MRALAVGFVLVLLAPGCMDDGSKDKANLPADGEPTPTPDENITPQLPPVVVNGTTRLPIDIRWSECKGFGMRVDGPGAGFFDAHVPPGWEPLASPTTSISILVYECQRVSWGGLERGPIFMLQERHGEFDAPPACIDDGDWQVYVMLESIWFSNADLAAAAKAFGMPAYHAATYSYERRDEGAGIMATTWTWALAGQEASHITHHALPLDNVTQNIITRVFWPSGDGVSYYDFDETFEHENTPSTPANGTMRAPMLYGRSMPNPSFATTEGGLKGSASASAKIVRFGDTQCQEPL